ncbi:hypothetical protein ACN27B_12195 [Micromonospora sp. WMMD754]|uniref:hypothetical protein n=1 Tax=Micromonospora sp. WMMD754 TaxID=3404114 RepID=UPI003BF58FFC
MRTDAEVVDLPAGTYVPAATRLRDLDKDVLDAEQHARLGVLGRRRWLLRLDEKDCNVQVVRDLVADGETDGVNQKHLCKTRKTWYSLEKVPPPDILVGPMGKERFRVVLNAIGAVPTNTLYAVRLRRRPVEPELPKLLADWLRSAEGQWAMASVARQHGLGVLKLEPSDLAQIPLPDWLADRLEPSYARPSSPYTEGDASDFQAGR